VGQLAIADAAARHRVLGAGDRRRRAALAVAAALVAGDPARAGAAASTAADASAHAAPARAGVAAAIGVRHAVLGEARAEVVTRGEGERCGQDPESHRGATVTPPL